MNDLYHKLDNPAWFALQETQSRVAVGNNTLKCYRKNVVAFAAFNHNIEDALAGLDNLMEPEESFFIIGLLPALPANYLVEKIIRCVQMICIKPIPAVAAGAPLEPLDEADEEQMYALVNRVLPGYYKPGTRQMGDYYGIRQNNKLVAMAGERIKLPGLTEISAVVTDPAFTGRRYAQQLVTEVVNKNFAQGITTFLHTGAGNERAIKIYEYLGFVNRRIINFTKIKRFI